MIMSVSIIIINAVVSNTENVFVLERVLEICYLRYSMCFSIIQMSVLHSYMIEVKSQYCLCMLLSVHILYLPLCVAYT